MTATVDIDQLYAQHIKSLSPEDRLRLIAIMAEDLASIAPVMKPRERSLLELEGLGAEIWRGIDAQEYVNELRAEWEREY